MSSQPVRLGLRENLPQFSLLVLINAFVGLMVGLERAVLPLTGRDNFHLTSDVAVLSFIVAFGFTKALTNLGAGALAQRAGLRRLLIVGWAVALPIPLLFATAPSWAWIVAANILLGINQGLAWSMTVVMKIDLVGPKRRGLALGLNEAAGYGGVALAAGLSGLLASQFAPRNVIVVAGAAFAVTAFRCRSCSCATRPRTSRSSNPASTRPRTPHRHRCERRSLGRGTGCQRCGPARRPDLSTTSTMAWHRGLVPLFLAAHGASVAQVGLVAAVYPAVWAVVQIATGHWSDTIGRKPLIVSGMLLQAAALGASRSAAARSRSRPPPRCSWASAPRWYTRP